MLNESHRKSLIKELESYNEIFQIKPPDNWKLLPVSKLEQIAENLRQNLERINRKQTIEKNHEY